jgi:hypothetical protein
MAATWYIKTQVGVRGPFSSAQLKGMAEAGIVLPATEVRPGNDGQWALAKCVKGLFGTAPQKADGIAAVNDDRIMEMLGGAAKEPSNAHGGARNATAAQPTYPAAIAPGQHMKNSAARPHPARTRQQMIYCTQCGQQNEENNFKCVQCGTQLHGQTRIVTDDGTLGGLIPTKNPKALWAYYLGVFALVPCFGIPLAIAALVVGIAGVKFANMHPEAKGAAHAWTGIILGAISLIIHLGFILLPILLSRH